MELHGGLSLGPRICRIVIFSISVQGDRLVQDLPGFSCPASRCECTITVSSLSNVIQFVNLTFNPRDIRDMIAKLLEPGNND